MTDDARILIQVMAGMIPEQPDNNNTQTWAITSREWETAGNAKAKWSLADERMKAVNEYAAGLRHSGWNWVRVDWIYL